MTEKVEEIIGKRDDISVVSSAELQRIQESRLSQSPYGDPTIFLGTEEPKSCLCINRGVVKEFDKMVAVLSVCYGLDEDKARERVSEIEEATSLQFLKEEQKETGALDTVCSMHTQIYNCCKNCPFYIRTKKITALSYLACGRYNVCLEDVCADLGYLHPYLITLSELQTCLRTHGEGTAEYLAIQAGCSLQHMEDTLSFLQNTDGLLPYDRLCVTEETERHLQSICAKGLSSDFSDIKNSSIVSAELVTADGEFCMLFSDLNNKQALLPMEDAAPILASRQITKIFPNPYWSLFYLHYTGTLFANVRTLIGYPADGDPIFRYMQLQKDSDYEIANSYHLGLALSLMSPLKESVHYLYDASDDGVTFLHVPISGDMLPVGSCIFSLSFSEHGAKVIPRVVAKLYDEYKIGDPNLGLYICDLTEHTVSFMCKADYFDYLLDFCVLPIYEFQRGTDNKIDFDILLG